VLPRNGTITPWSSKASDIIKNCGFEYVKSIERAEVVSIIHYASVPIDWTVVYPAIHDKMTHSVMTSLESIDDTVLATDQKCSIKYDADESDWQRFNTDNGLALNALEINHLRSYYNDLKRDPTDTELFMYAQINSEHCRHKIFNSKFTLDNSKEALTLFEMIKNTHNCAPNTHVLSAYSDNAAVIKGSTCLSNDSFITCRY